LNATGDAPAPAGSCPRAPGPGRRRARAWILAGALLAAACHTLPPPVGIERSYSGRFALSVTRAATPGAEAEHKAWSGRFALAVGPQNLALDLVSPLGATIARFETDAHEARLLVPADGGVRVEHGPDAQLLSEQVLGWSLPVVGMTDWVEGRPAAGRPSVALPDDAGHRRFEQDGWDVTVQPPEGGRRGLLLQIDRAARDAAPAVALRVVLDGPAT
jgi:outer membrane lipoprotein LolB